MLLWISNLPDPPAGTGTPDPAVVGVAAPFEDVISSPPTPGSTITSNFQEYVQVAGNAGLPSTCHIQTTILEPDGAGGYSESNPINFLNVPCRIRRGTGTETQVGDGRRRDQLFMFTCSIGQPLVKGDRIWSDGAVYEVQTVGRGTLSTVRRASIRRLS